MGGRVAVAVLGRGREGVEEGGEDVLRFDADAVVVVGQGEVGVCGVGYRAGVGC